ncbi:DNA helicase ATP-dependent RecQ type [Neofusicoccum parvum]|uniref:DNA helicase ATP-dependent RecQ type n=1 Tax=Neofusicoccum parvum TaxID=310453 RepID=A0ACB5SDW8_9PEZI|nr:DNA helicase ATP-dependent RecQ type [Neofusicoccum parvum]
MPFTLARSGFTYGVGQVRQDDETKDESTSPLSVSQESDLIRELVKKDLAERDRELSQAQYIYRDQTTKTEVSPWLEMTRWPSLFNSLDLSNVSPLAYAADPATEPLLVRLSESLDRLVERAYQSICEDKISVFDQARINSFMASDVTGWTRRMPWMVPAASSQ